MNFVVAPEAGQRQHFNYQWKEVTPGNHDITLAVTDNEGASTLSRPVKVMVIGDEDLPELTIFTKDALATETTDNASAPSDTATFRIRRTGRTDTALEVSYQTSGSAANGIDYEGLEGSMVIESGQRWGKVILKPIADDMREGRETIALSLVPSILTYAVGHPSTAKAVIMDTPPERGDTKIMKDGSIHLRLPSVPGENFLLEVSENLKDWEVIDHGVTQENAFDIIESRPEQQKRKYFRIRKALKAITDY
jgi:hypothetical protein